MVSTNCPTRDELAGFAIGDMSRDVFDRIAGHIADCPTCDAAIEEIESRDDHPPKRPDELLDALRSGDHLAYVEFRDESCSAANGISPGGDANGQQPESPRDNDSQLPESAVSQSWIAKAVAARSQAMSSAVTESSLFELPLPRRLGKFELQERLGSGSFGHVFRAIDTELERTVAVKVLRASGFAGQEDVDRFLREARGAARLKHPGVMMLFGTGKTEDGTYFLVQEFIQGKTLEALLENDDAQSGEGNNGEEQQIMESRTAARWAMNIAEAMAYAHDAGVIHRDVKPSNIIVDEEGNPHLMDFGLAKFDTDDSQMTPDGQVMGTPAYMSPEQARGEIANVDGRSDVYSLGIVLYEMLTGRRPFRGNRQAVLMQVLDDEPEPPRKRNPKIPRDLETICLKAIEKDPKRRYQSADDLADDLRRFTKDEPIHARPVSTRERMWRWCRRNPLAASLMFAMTLGTAFGLFSMWKLSDDVIRRSAINNAETYSRLLETVNTHYSSQVVDRLDQEQVAVTHDYKNAEHAVPVPATFLTELGDRVSGSESGMKVRHFSDFPFRTRTDGGPRDEFERDALESLRQSPAKPYYLFTEIQGQPILRYATARIMQRSCVECHNNHADSIKQDWKVGDVRGVLEIIRPLEKDAVRARDGLGGAFTLMGLVILLMWGASALVLVTVNTRRRRAGKLKE